MHDLTIVTWGAMVQETLEAADKLSQRDGVTAEVIDVATLKPLDMADHPGFGGKDRTLRDCS